MAALRITNLVLRFLLELAALGAFAYWGATSRAPAGVRVALAVIAPLAIAVLWGAFISPKARFSTGRIGQAGLGLVVFIAAAAALFVRGHVALAQTFALVSVASSILLYALPQ
jgi:hypothetical protein